MKRDIAELDTYPIPATLLTVVNSSIGQRAVYIWNENLSVPTMQFNCVKVITPASPFSQDRLNIFEADFL
jgi:hypothetical protein